MPEPRSAAAASPPNLYGLGRSALEDLVRELGHPAYRSRQLFAHLYRRDALEVAGWSDLPAPFRQDLAGRCVVQRPQLATRAIAADRTIKTTLDLPRGGRVEAVAIREPSRTTFCISSQVGCGFGCAFCMTAKLGFGRNLDAGEIVGQVAALVAETGVAPGGYNIVFMGMGEPLHNYAGVVEALRLLVDADGFALGPRRITLSTVGLAPRIRDLAHAAPPIRLAVSLVAADQDLRASLMPVAKRWPLPELADAIRAFGEGRRDRPTLEVVMLAGVNDDPALAPDLARYAQRCRAKVNLIEFNPTPELPYRPSPEARIQHFLEVLARYDVVGTVRRSRGQDAFAACGQLAFLEGKAPNVVAAPLPAAPLPDDLD